MILPENLTAVSRLKVRLTEKIVSKMRLGRPDFCNKVTGKNETKNLKKLAYKLFPETLS